MNKEQEEPRIDASQIDPADFNTLLNAILRQSMDDYIKLQHPKFRSKKYLQEAFDSAINMLFDSSYRFLYVRNELDEEMSLKEMVSFLLNDDRVKIDNLKNHVIQEAQAFWETKLVRTLYIPDSFIYDGHVYKVEHRKDTDSEIDFENKTIFINKKRGSEGELQFFEVAINIAFYHEDIVTNKSTRDLITKSLFRMLKMNSCFTGS